MRGLEGSMVVSRRSRWAYGMFRFRRADAREWLADIYDFHRYKLCHGIRRYVNPYWIQVCGINLF